MAVLVTGGAGFIGSVVVRWLMDSGEETVVLDDLARGHREAVPKGTILYQGRVGDRELTRDILNHHEINACLHFAALAYVGESVQEPRRYYENNVREGIVLLGALLDGGVEHFVLSSSCAVYGAPNSVPVDESQPRQPESPYGWSKYIMERCLADYEHSYKMRYVSLRYFNAAGAIDDCGEDHDPETHLIPIAIQTALGQREQVEIFGDDYPTPDGTAVRDYVHVADLADAHVRALEYLRSGRPSVCLNLGTGHGYGVREVIQSVRRVSGGNFAECVAPRRPGDPASLAASCVRAKEVLGWSPRFVTLDAIIETAWTWHSTHPNGY